MSDIILKELIGAFTTVTGAIISVFAVMLKLKKNRSERIELKKLEMEDADREFDVAIKRLTIAHAKLYASGGEPGRLLERIEAIEKAEEEYHEKREKLHKELVALYEG